MHRSPVAAVAAFVLASCATPVNVNLRTAIDYSAAGDRAMASGDLVLAKQNYERALASTQMGRVGPAAQAAVAGKLGRVLGNLCEHDQAEKTFLLAVNAEDAAYGTRSVAALNARVELAQHSFDIERYADAAAYYEHAFATAGTFLENRDPQGTALLLQDYATALRKSGKGDAADAAATKAASLATRTGIGPVVRRDYIRYPKTCTPLAGRFVTRVARNRASLQPMSIRAGLDRRADGGLSPSERNPP